MTGTGRWGLAATGLFVALAVATLVSWEAGGDNPVTGDEPHYLVMADSLVSDRSLEVTAAYRREFRTTDIYDDGLAAADAEPDESNTHAVDGPRGLFSVHSYGLPIVVAIPFALGGVVLAKLAMIAIAATGGWVAWRMSARHAGSDVERALAVGVVISGMTFVTAASQLYPDVPAGVLALVGLAAIQGLEVRWTADVPLDAPAPPDASPDPTVDGAPPGRHPAWTVALVAMMPWFHIKTAATAVLLCSAIAALDWWRHRSMSRSVLSLLPLAISGFALLAYNTWAFGQATGPYSDGALQIGGMPLTVLLGLYVDQFQGMFVQNPALLMALFALVPFVRRFPVTGVALVITHLSLVVPNALHENWYGGFSFAGRFGVSGALVLVPVAVFGISEALARRTTVVPLLAIGAAGAYHGVQFVRYGLLDRDLYNNTLALPGAYPSHLPFARSVLPMFYRAEWALRFAPNVAAVATCAAIIAVGAWSAMTTRERVRSSGGIAAVVGAAIVAVGAVAASTPDTVIRVPGSSLALINAVRDGPEATATGAGGVVTAGPYVLVGPGVHSFQVRYRGDDDPATDDEVIGDWVLGVGPNQPVANGALIGAGAERVDGVEYDVPPELAGRRFELLTATPPGVELEVIEVTITPVDSPDG